MRRISSTNSTKDLEREAPYPRRRNRSMMQSPENYVMHLTWPKEICSTGSFCLALGNGRRRALAGLRRVGISPLCFADNNPGSQGREILRVSPVLSPAEAANRFATSAVFVITVCSTFRKTGCKTESNSCETSAVSEWFLQFFFGNIQRNSYHFSLWICPTRFSHIHQRYEQPWILERSPHPVRNSHSAQKIRLMMDFDRMGNPKGADAYFQTGLFED